MASREMQAVSFTVPVTAGNYAPERLSFGQVGTGQAHVSYWGVTASVDASVAGSVVELWLPRAGAAAPYVDADYAYSGKSISASGAETWVLAGYPGAQLRVKSGGTAGTATVSASALAQ